MANRVHLYSPNTSRQHGTTNSQHLGTLKVVVGKRRRDEDLDGRSETVHHAHLPVAMRHLTTVQLANGLNDYFGQRCNCQHDCCGCFFGGVYTVERRGRHIAFTTVYQRNV